LIIITYVFWDDVCLAYVHTRVDVTIKKRAQTRYLVLYSN